jgi:undecaprenyl-diphosphatase
VSPLEAALLGLLQGLSEFFPVSSSGHLVLGQALLGLSLPGVGFEVAVHVATVAAVIVVYRARLVRLGRGLAVGQKEALTYVGMLVLASVPAAAAGLLARSFLEGFYERPSAAAAFLLLSGLFAWSIDRSSRTQAGGDATLDHPGLLGSLAVGVAQALAILPGLSRSGSTVAIGARAGVGVVQMAEFSFLLSIPAIGGAAVLQLVSGEAAIASTGLPALLTGFMVAMVSGVLAIRLFVHLLETRHFRWFAYYCWLVGSSYLIAALAVAELR